MLSCFSKEENHSAISAVPLTFVAQKDFPAWLSAQTGTLKDWLSATQFKADPGTIRLIPDAKGNLVHVVCGVVDNESMWNTGHLPFNLPEGKYKLNTDASTYHLFAIAWGLGAYQFTRYKKPLRQAAQLVWDDSLDQQAIDDINNLVESIYLVRDCINLPTDDLGPSELAKVVEKLAKQYHAKFKQIVGEELLEENYHSIYTVGRASDDVPRLLDLCWGNENHPKVTLVGKGVCFDSGGLDLKSSAHMLLMKKDMGGAAHVLGLARMIMQAKLPIRLRVLIPAVENVISGNAYRPGDVIKSKKGLTVEIGNTDAEGRVVLSDALTEAVSEQPELLIDMATLTGAARVALGTELPALFSNHDDLADAVLKQAEIQKDPMWRLPLFSLYREYLNSTIADINNNASEPYGGAITAALFLKEFVPDNIPWLHFDLMAWNLRTRPGRPQGGEAMALRALFAYLKSKFIVTS